MKEEYILDLRHQEMQDKLVACVIGIMLLLLTGLCILTVFATVNLTNINKLQKDVKQATEKYEVWSKDNPNASLTEKKNTATDLTKELTIDGATGIAFDSTNGKICAWKPKAMSNTIINHAVSADSNYDDCSSMETIIAPTGVSAEKPVAKQQESTPAPEFPWSMLLGILATVGVVLAGTGGIIFGVKKASATRKKRKDETLALDTKIDNLFSRHNAVRMEWSAYEMNPMKMLDYPLLSDMREKTTSDLLLSLRKANSLRENNTRKSLVSPTVLSSYEESVLELEHAFEVAEREAKRVRWSQFSDDERKRLNTAKNLLSFVMDNAATEHERQTAYKRLTKELEGLVQLPAITLNVLENGIQKMVAV